MVMDAGLQVPVCRLVGKDADTNVIGTAQFNKVHDEVKTKGTHCDVDGT